VPGEISIERQRTFYNERWDPGGYLSNAKLQRCAAILEAVAATRVERPEIVELGCGAGWLTAILGLYGPALGVDLSDAAIEHAARLYPHAKFLAADVMTWDYPRAAFDLVVSHEVLEHMDDQQGYLRVARGLLREGGHLILTTPNRATVETLPEPVRSTLEGGQPIQNWVDLHSMRRMLGASFRVRRLTTFLHAGQARGVRRVFNSPRLRALTRSLRIDDALEHLGYRLGLGMHILAVAEAR
jgi:SAM-dependent methyltransferase